MLIGTDIEARMSWSHRVALRAPRIVRVTRWILIVSSSAACQARRFLKLPMRNHSSLTRDITTIPFAEYSISRNAYLTRIAQSLKLPVALSPIALSLFRSFAHFLNFAPLQGV